ncbi:MAG TPA: glycoside hydrolase family 9 protein [Polyangiaceae bacterium]|nr:glycoside hydrolase family 9 protein [Polyangiaceae bacterium]
MSAVSGSASGAPALGGGTGGTAPAEGEVSTPVEPLSPFIVVDQFGYLPEAEKIAVLRDPEAGFDESESYTPGSKYELVDAATKAVVSELSAVAWNGGQVDDKSGDRAWRVDFSVLKAPGVYFLRDVEAKVRSDVFRVADDVYRQVLRHAFRTFFYQRAGFEKKAEFAGAGWADTASHLGSGQDKNARLYGKTDDATTERDLSGGWYDAGDLNRYTPWTADYIVALLRAYEETPSAFGDDFGLPESGNGQSDLLDEVRFGLEHLQRLQSESGGFISVLGVAGASPPSSAKGPSVYGPETTNATLRAGTALAWAARIFRSSDAAYASALLDRAKQAWAWAELNPAAKFENTGKVAAGEQQSSDKEVALYKLGFAVALHRADAGGTFKSYFEDNYAASGLGVLNGYNAAWELQLTELFLDYTRMPDAAAQVKQAIVQAFATTIAAPDNLGTLTGDPDPYLAYVADYTWGSNSHKARTGCLQYDVISFGIDAGREGDARRAAERYVHYLHGVNPLGLVYLSNMGGSGAARSATTFYHTWFADKSPRWDEVGVSTDGPPPGFLVGGPNPSYDWDGVCPGNAMCPAARPTPPYGQPPQKSYANFNDSWPVNSWSVTENSDGYQVYYLRLLSKFVR